MKTSRFILTSLAVLAIGFGSLPVEAQETWSIDRCMAYAVEHNRTVKQRTYEASNYRLDRMKAIGSFLPSVNGSIGVQYNYGRSVDPETNTYNNISTFNNGYALETSIPVFRGGSLINEVRRSRANVLLGKAALQEARDNTALETFQAYINALYYYGTARLARQKLADSDSLLYKTRRQEELGLKGAADVAQVAAQQATDAYHLTHQENLYATALLTLKQQMNLPAADTLLLDTCLLEATTLEQVDLQPADAGTVYQIALRTNPTLRQAEMRKQVANMERKKSLSAFFPSISFYAGISSSYYKELHKTGYPSWKKQLDTNFGQYFGFSMSIPLFNRLTALTHRRQAVNNYHIAVEQYEAQKEELQKLVLQAIQDREGYLKESLQMEKKVSSDALTYRVTRRKFEEGLMTSLDVKNNAATLLESQTLLLQSRLTYLMKCRLVDYYQGKELVIMKNEE